MGYIGNVNDAKELLEKKLTRSLTTISLSTGLQQTKKRKLSEIVGLRTSEAPAPEHEASIGTIFKVHPSSLVHHCPHSSTSTDYWSSPEAIKLFGTRELVRFEETIQPVRMRRTTLTLRNVQITRK